MFFVQSGSCNVIVDGVVKATRTRGDFFGEIALVYASERMADVVACDDCEVYALSRARFLTVAAQFPQIYQRLKDTGAERVERQGWSEKMKKDKMQRGVKLHPELEHNEWNVLVSFCDELLDAIALLPPDPSSSYSSHDLCDILEEVMACFEHTSFVAGQLIVPKGTSELGINLVCTGAAVIEKGGSRTEMTAGSHMGLITLFFTGTALHEVCAGESGAGVWSLHRAQVMKLCENFPFLQDALRDKALAQTRDIAKFPHLSTV